MTSIKKGRFAHAMMPFISNGGHPDRVLAADTETHPRESNSEIQDLTLGWYMAEDLMNKRSKNHKEGEFTNTDEFWDIAEEMCTFHKPLTITALNMGGFDSKVLEAEAQLKKRGWEITSVIIPKPFIIRARQQIGIIKGGKPRYRKMTIIDLSNFYPMMSVKFIGSKLGMPKGDPDGGPAHSRYYPSNGCIPGSEVWEVLSKYCRRDTEIVLRAIEQYVKFCLENELGPWRETISGQALTAWSNIFLDPITPIMHIHNSPAALKLEREAYHGAVTDVWRKGEFRDKNGFWYHDVNSLYPSVMRANTYPVKLLSRRKGISIADTRKERIDRIKTALERGQGVIAKVLIDTDMSKESVQTVRTFPVVNDNNKLVFPVGRIKTVLTSREVELALGKGIIYDVLEVCYYTMMPIFVSYVDKFYALKDRFGREGNKVFYLITKLFLNGLYGKWAQHNPEWDRCDDWEFPNDQNVEVFVTSDNKRITYRRYAGLIEKTNGVVKEAFNSFPGLAAHITADARLTLFRCREIAGTDHCYYGDTDSLLTDYQGHLNLDFAGILDDHELGLMKHEIEEGEKIPTRLNIVAPKTYQIGNRPWVRKGIRKDAAKQIGDNVFWQIQFEGLGGAMRYGNPNEARVKTVKKRITGNYEKGIIREDNWIDPFTVEMWKYE